VEEEAKKETNERKERKEGRKEGRKEEAQLIDRQRERERVCSQSPRATNVVSCYGCIDSGQRRQRKRREEREEKRREEKRREEKRASKGALL
jgi:hypothetical protein